ncbi:MAG TPA: hypothetical protein VFT61_09820 [Sphingomicrobium sp.]|nr:hypothetical protein [Sphingomicrobium sp.]
MGTAAGDRVFTETKERTELRILLLGAVLMLAACSRGGGGDQNLGAASGNSLTSAQIDAALGPANQQDFSANTMNEEVNTNSTQLNAETNTTSR